MPILGSYAASSINGYESVVQSVTPSTYKIYGVQIDTTNSNPSTALTYTDDAVGMTGGSSTWDSTSIFSNIKPCMLLNGSVNYYLSPSDYTKKFDNITASDITSGNDGDVMIEIPKMAYSIVTNGNYVYVKITDNPSPINSTNENWHFYAHTRSTEGDKSKLYVGAYLGYTLSSKLRSLSGKIPTANQTIGTFRTQAQANGTGYDQLSFYPLTLLQCLYVIRYKNLDSQTALGRGYVDGNSSSIATGGTNTKGMYYGETTGKLQMKFCGIEDLWGNLRCVIDGLYINSNYNILTAFVSFNNNGNGYNNRGQGVTSSMYGYISLIQGTTESGFISKATSGSDSTYYSDFGAWGSSIPIYGSYWVDGSYGGTFALTFNSGSSSSDLVTGSRLMYL